MEVFTDPREFFERLRQGRERADGDVLPWQEKMTTGGCFIRVIPGVMIFCEIIELKYEEDRERFRSPHMRNIRPCRCYSELCIEGEYGSVHVATALVQISREQFEKARANDWKGNKEALLTYLLPGGFKGA